MGGHFSSNSSAFCLPFLGKMKQSGAVVLGVAAAATALWLLYKLLKKPKKVIISFVSFTFLFVSDICAAIVWV